MDLEVCLRELKSEKENMISRVIQWANVNSHTFNVSGLERMASLLIEAFSPLQCEAQVIALPSIESIDDQGLKKHVACGPLLRFWKRPTASLQVLLVGHMDTVFAVDHPFQKTTRKSDEVLQGPGVTDMKGGLCVLLEALKLFEKHSGSEQLGWEVLINPDEEIGSLASAAYLRERAKHHQVGLLFEPAMDETGMLAGERKGSGKFVIMVHGRAAHAGRDFSLGRNAIVALAKIVTDLNELNGKRPGVTINVGQIHGGGSVNVVPAFAICRLDVRIQKRDDEQWVTDHLSMIVATANQQEGFNIEWQGAFTRKPKEITGKTLALYELVAKTAEGINQTIHWKPSGGVSDGNTLAEAGLPNVDTLGVCGGNIHSEEEYLMVDSLVSRSLLTAAVLWRLLESSYTI